MIAKANKVPARERYESSVRKSVLVVVIALGSQTAYIVYKMLTGGMS